LVGEKEGGCRQAGRLQADRQAGFFGKKKNGGRQGPRALKGGS